MDTSAYNCKDSCVYQKDGSSDMFCFGVGSSQYQCSAATTTPPSSGGSG